MKSTNRKKWCVKTNKINFTQDFSLLVVDDSHNQCNFIANMLGNSNIKVTKAFDGFEAFDKVKKMYEVDRQFMVVLMDVHMPNFDGYEGTKMIRRYEEEKDYPKTYIYAVSADEDDMVISKSKENKMDNFLVKPISKPNLDKIIKERAMIVGFDINRLGLK